MSRAYRDRRRCAAAGVALAAAFLAVVAANAPAGAAGAAGAAGTNARPPYPIAQRTLRIVEHRTMRLPGGRVVPRTLVTYLRYPTGRRGPFPLIVFGHGFAVTPHPYRRLLDAWAQAGYVVAAPVFPLGNAHAPGGPDENDILNQPGDMSAVITRLIGETRRASDPLGGLIDEHEIAVAGQSDGAETALAVAYGRPYRDRRVRAAMILSGAELPIGYSFASGSPPLLAVQGTADTMNLPRNTYKFFRRAMRPKFLLRLLGAGHLPPYTTQQPQLGIVQRTTTAFLDRYLNHEKGALNRLEQAGRVRGLTNLSADP